MKKGSSHKEETKAKISEATKENAGRPTLYKSEYDEQVFKLCLLGAIDSEIANFFNVDERTINNWKAEHKTFFQSIINGREKADAEVANALYNRAKGYEVPDVKIFQFQGSEVIVPYTKIVEPDVQAASLWLRNRQPKKWRDKIEHTGGTNEDGTDKLRLLTI
jgi:hypothetical protein